MKKISTIAVACAGLLSFTACNNFLDEEPKSTLTDVAYYKTQSQMESNVTICIVRVRSVVMWISVVLISGLSLLFKKN